MQLGRETFDLTKQIGTPQPDLGSIVPAEPGRGHGARHRGIGVEEFGNRLGGRHGEDSRVPVPHRSMAGTGPDSRRLGIPVPPPATRRFSCEADCPGSPWSLPSSV